MSTPTRSEEKMPLSISVKYSRKKIALMFAAALILASCLLTGCHPSASGSEMVSGSGMIGQSESSLPETSRADSETTGQEEQDAEIQPEEDSIDAILRKMTLREKVGQLFIIRPDALDVFQTPAQVNNSSAAGVTALSEAMAEQLKDHPVGGIAMFGKNITDPEQLAGFIETLQTTSDIPLFLAVDEEGGPVARLANHAAFDLPRYKSAAAVGASGDPSDALAMGAVIGAYLRKYGFNMDFAPVADVNTNPDNPVIGNRAFSSDAKTAAEMASAMADGLKQQGIVPVFKHFPGHGDTAEDSHSGIAVSHKTKEEMESCEWLPYQSLTGEDCVMVGHIAAPEVTGNLTPASMSPQIVNDILRQQLGFEGLVMTDSLAMGAITEEYDSGEAAIKAIEAGCDVLLGPENFQEAFEALVEAVKSGTISEGRIDESVHRILLFKKAYGILG